MKIKRILSVIVILNMLFCMFSFLGVAASGGITTEYVTGNSDGIITDYLRLPDQTEDGTEILYWESSDSQKICVGGFDAYPLSSEKVEKAILTAVTKNESYTVEVSIPALSINEIVLMDEDFDNVEVGEVPTSDSIVGWSVASETASVGVAEDTDDVNNRYLLMDVEKQSRKNDMFVTVDVDTTNYERLSVSYDMEVLSGTAVLWPAFGQVIGSDKLFEVTQSADEFTFAGTSGKSENITAVTPGTGVHSIELKIYQPNIGVGNVEVLIDGEKINLINDGLWTAGKKLFMLPFGFERGTKGNFKIDNISVKAIEDERTVLNKDLFELDLGELTNIDKKLSLPEHTENGYEIFWCSKTPDNIDNSGNVHLEAEAREAILCALIKSNGTWCCREFNIQLSPMWEGGIVYDDINGNINNENGSITLPTITRTGYEIVSWESSDPERLLILDNKAYPMGGDEETTVTITPVLDESYIGSSQSFDVTVQPLVIKETCFVDEDFESVPVDGLPESNDLVEWSYTPRLGYSTNGYLGVIHENGESGNKVLRVAHFYATGDIKFVVDTKFNASDRGTVVIEYDFVSLYGAMVNWPSPTTLGGSSTVRVTQSPESTLINGDSSYPAYKAENQPGWNHFKLSFDASTTTFDAYINNKLIAENVLARNTIIRNAPFGYLKEHGGDGYIDNLVIKEFSDGGKSVAETYLSTIDIGNVNAIDEDVTLPTHTPYGNAEIIWHTSNPDVIDTDGHITRQPVDGENTNASLYALIYHENNWVCRKIDVTVLREMSDEELIDQNMQHITLPETQLLTQDLKLPADGFDGVQIHWESSHPDIINPETGKVTLPEYTGGKITEVTLSAWCTIGDSASEKRNFTFHVPDNNLAMSGVLAPSSTTLDSREQYVIDFNDSTAWKMDDDLIKQFDITFHAPTTINYVTIDGDETPELLWSLNGVDYRSLGSGNSFTFAPKEVKHLRLQYNSDSATIRELGIYLLMNDVQCVKMDSQDFDLGDVKSITSNLVIPTTGVNGSVITCVSDNQAVITNDGHVTRPAGDDDVTVNLTFTFTKGTESETLVIPVTVKCKGNGSGGTSDGRAPSGAGQISSGKGGGSRTPAFAPVSNVVPDTSSNAKTEETVVFTDIDNHWAETEIIEFYNRGIVSGDGNGNFAPDRAVTRAEFVKLLLGTLNIEIEENDIIFDDVDPNAWYSDYISTATTLGFIKGIDEKTFAPEQSISRADMAVILSRVFKHEMTNHETDFNDKALVPEYAAEAVNLMASIGVLSGYPDGSFRPMENVSRAQATVALYRFSEKLQETE